MHIVFPGSDKGVIKIFLIDGKKVLEQDWNSSSLTLDLSTYQRGTYLFVFESPGRRISRRVVLH
ncbi:MAG: T9SS type A sorting domain-containing protein [Bacteroidia bacterium]|nr:T9SS type A sorting domain-containing protein [Bacteroidia bacterium]